MDDGRGAFVRGRDFGVGRYPYDIAFGVIDGDGDLDVGVANWGSGTVSILRLIQVF